MNATTAAAQTSIVTIAECKLTGRRWSAECKTSDKWTAIARAVRANFGPGTFFWHDTSIKQGDRVYGQVMRKLGRGSDNNTSVTSKIWIDVDIAE